MSNKLNDFQGKRALVTGAGDGIGEMLAKNLAGAGLSVVVQDIRLDAAERVAQEIGEAATPIAFDVSDREACMSAAETIAKDGPLNLLWANAGVGVGASILKGRPNAIEWAVGVNVLGVVWTTQAFVPLMASATGPRHVGFTASSAALRKAEGAHPLYATSKHATFAFAESLSTELANEGINSTILCPGLLNTKIWDGARARPDRFGGPRFADPALSKQWDEAKPPQLMWPEIVRTIEAGGGYLTCATDNGETRQAFESRAETIAAHIVQI